MAEGMPEQLLRCAIAVYAMRRVVAYRDEVEEAGHSRRGGLAGCGLITTFIKSYIMQAIDRLISAWASDFVCMLRLDIYIDDYVLSGFSPGGQHVILVSDLLQASEQLRDTIKE